MKLIKFSADWCVPCKNLARRLEALPLTIEVVSYDVEDDVDLTEEWKIRSVPTTILLDDSGNEVKRWVGSFDPSVELKDFVR